MPKGVELTHRNLLANIRSAGKALGFRSGDVGVIWLPLYHDMGLIGAVLGTLHFSIPLILFSPVDFIQNPKRWLWAVHKYRGTLSAAPNFAYSLCARKVKDSEIEGLDLSSWRLAINGAEPIHPETLEGFSRRFAPYGFSSSMFLSAYGLAEATLAVSFTALDAPPPVRTYDREGLELKGVAAPVQPAAGRGTDSKSVSWVSAGRPIPEHRVRITDADGRDLPERTVGSVTVQGPSLMRGYFRNPEATRSAIRDGWLYTGDLGFIDGGELFITGRSKDVIIKGGRNYYPQDIEAAAGSIEGVRPGCVTAFSVPNPAQGTEEVVVVAETRLRSSRSRGRLGQEIRKKVHQDVGCGLDRVLLVPPGTVSKTSSGKLQRSLSRQRYLSGKLIPSRARILWHWARLYLRGLWPPGREKYRVGGK
jgi:acyl-CoA synthetase (AMP-forming)/AMP-acid ligase II